MCHHSGRNTMKRSEHNYFKKEKNLSSIMNCYNDLHYSQMASPTLVLDSFITPKGHFTQWPSVEWTKDSGNVIGGEQNFVYSAFILKANGQRTTPSNMPTWQHFLWVLVPRLCVVDESLSTIFMETQSLLKETNFSF